MGKLKKLLRPRPVSAFFTFVLLFNSFSPVLAVIGDTNAVPVADDTVEAEAQEEAFSEDVVIEEEDDKVENEEQIVEEPVVENAVAEEEPQAVETEKILSTSIEGSKIIYGNISTGVDYKYHNNDSVYIKFLTLPKGDHWVSIAEVETEFGIGYKFLTDMTDGTFLYNLTLPNQNNSDVEVKFSEDNKTFETVENTVQPKKNLVTIYDLDHFTVFVVVNPLPVAEGDACLDGDECYDTIQEAVNAAAEKNGADTIKIKANTYNEGVIINDNSLTIEGPNAGVPANGARNPEAIINGYFKVNGGNITIDGLKFVDGAKVPAGELAAMHIVGGNENVRIYNSIFERTGTLDFDNSRGVINEFGGITNLRVENSYFTGWHTGVYTQHASATIQNNSFVSNEVGTSSDFPKNVQILDNQFTENQFEAIGVGGSGKIQVKIEGNNFLNNTKGIENYIEDEIINAEKNDWNTNSGPYDPTSEDGSVPDTNPDGEGDRVNGAVRYGNWTVFDDPITINILSPATVGETFGDDFDLTAEFLNDYNFSGIYIDLVDPDLTEPAATVHRCHWANQPNTVTKTCTIDPDVPFNLSGTFPEDKLYKAKFTAYQTAAGTPGFQYKTVYRDLYIDNTAPVMTDINMFVNGEDRDLTKPGDTVRIVADVVDATSPVEKIQIWVRENPWNPNHNELISGQMSHVSGDTYEFIFIVPDTYKDGDPLNEAFEGNYFNFRPWDSLGNSMIGYSQKYTIDATAPSAPIGLQYIESVSGDIIQCNGYTDEPVHYPDWADNTEEDLAYYDYTSFWGTDGHVGTRRELTESVFTHNWKSPEGTFGYKVRAVDEAGNKSDWSLSPNLEEFDSSCKINVDYSAPDAPTPLTPDDGTMVKASKFTQTWTNEEGAVLYEYESCNVNPGDLGDDCTSVKYTNSYTGTTKTVNAGQPNSHFWWRVRAKDAADNWSSWSIAFELYIDAEAPVTVFTSPEEGDSLNESIVLGGTTTDNFEVDLVNLYYREGEGEWTLLETLTAPEDQTTWNWTSSPWTPDEGTYDFMAKGVDVAGNVEDTAYLYNISYDVTAPTAPMINGVFNRDTDEAIGCEGYTSTPRVKFTWDPSEEEDVAGYWFGTQFNDHHQYFAHPIDFKNATMTPGHNPYYYTLIAVDEAGNESEPSEHCTLTLDMEAPAAPVINFPLEGSYHNSQPILNDWTDVDDDSGIAYYRIEYVYDDNHYFSGAPYRTTTISQRNHTPGLNEEGGVKFRVQAIDLAGNEGAWSDWRHYFYDHSAPTVPTNLHFETDSEEVLSCGSVTNELEVTVQWDDSTDDVTDVRNYVYEITYVDPNTGKESTWSTTVPTSQYHGSFAPKGEGLRNVRVKSVDMAGNSSDWSDTCSVFYDSTSPIVDITSHVTGDVLSGQVLLQGLIEEPNLSHYNISLYPDIEGTCNKDLTWDFSKRIWQKDGNSNNVEHTLTTTDYQDGFYMIRLAARDLAGNRDPLGNTGEGVSVEVICVEIDNHGIVRGAKFEDVNQNSEWDETENGIADWKIYVFPDIYQDNDIEEYSLQVRQTPEPIQSTETDEDGNYEFDLPRGRYVVCEESKENWVQTYPDRPHDSKPNFIEENINVMQYCHLVVVDGNNEEEAVFNFGNYEDLQPEVSASAGVASFTTGGSTVLTANVANPGNEPLTFNWSGDSTWCTGTTQSINFEETNPGVYKCTVEVKDLDGDTDEADVIVTVNAVSIPDNQNSPGTDTDGLVGGVNTNRGYGYWGYGDGIGEGLVPNASAQGNENEEDQNGDVLGVNCENRRKASGFVYITQDDNNTKDDGENGVEDVTLSIYYFDNGERKLVTTTNSDANGYWEADLCPGNYEMDIDTEDLDEGVSIKGEETVKFTVSEGEDLNDVNVLLEEDDNGLNWLLVIIIPIIIIILLAGIYYFLTRDQEKLEV